MKYIKEQDYQYIMNKYHDITKPYDSMQRFIRHDEIFDAESGMAPDQIYAGIYENDKQFAHLSHPVRKARALAFILKNTRISCDVRDIFPAINMVDRPLNKTLIKLWRDETLSDLIPEAEARRASLEQSGTVTIWLDYDHSVPVWSRLFSLGFIGILEESERIRKSKPLTPEQDAFYEGIRITYESILAFLDRLICEAKSQRMKDALTQIRNGAPTTFYEALLLCYLYFMISEHIDTLQVRSLSCFDRDLYPFYEKDLTSGVCEEELRETLAYYLLQFTAIDNYFNQPVFLGGEKADGTSITNELSFMFLDVYDEMGILNPKIQIKVCKSTPKPFVEKALDMIRRGHNSIVFVSDETIRKALMRMGVSAEEARECNVTGCYEYSPQGAYNAGMNYFNLLKPLEYVLHKGCDGVTGVFSGLESPDVSEYKSFDEVFAEYKKHLSAAIDATIKTANELDLYLGHINPLSLLSATFPSCLEKGKDAICGGSAYNDTPILFGFLADISDSLAMIQKYVFEKRELTLRELVEALDKNFVGYEKLQRKLYLDRDKYGNNKERPDDIAVEISRFVTERVFGRANARTGKYYLGFHVARMSYIQGKQTAASANGRRFGEELAKNISASMGQNREGATAAILSATQLDAASFGCDAALDLGLLPSAVRGDDGLAAMYGLLMTFVNRGGHALHINVFDAETLRDAQQHPEKYEDLQIRVCGWNVLWNNINKEEQDGFIRQAEGLC